MKTSQILLSFLLSVLFLPPALIKLDLLNKFKNNHWSFHSSKKRMDMKSIKNIELIGIKTFQYVYAADSSYLEFHKDFGINNYDRAVSGDTLHINNESLKSPMWQREEVFIMDKILGTLFKVQTFMLMPTTGLPSATGSQLIIFYGPQCPPINAINSNFAVDSIGPDATFKFDLDFSTFTWENYKKIHG